MPGSSFGCFCVPLDRVSDSLLMAHDMRDRRNMETPEQTEGRRIKMAHDMRERRNMETPEQTEGRIDFYINYTIWNYLIFSEFFKSHWTLHILYNILYNME